MACEPQAVWLWDVLVFMQKGLMKLLTVGNVKVRPDVAIQVQSLTVQAVWLLIFFPLMYSVTIVKSQEVGMCVSDGLILSFFI